MSIFTKAIFTGLCGAEYDFSVHPLDTKFKNICAIYMFAYEDENGNVFPLYIGESTRLGERLDNHEKKKCAILHHCNRICVMPVQEGNSFKIETDLIQAYEPPCNLQQ